MGTNSGRYSKFQERLKKIVRSRLKKKTKGVDQELSSQELQRQFINDKVTEIHNVMARETSNRNVYVNKRVGKNKEKIVGSIIEEKEDTTFLNININKNEVVDSRTRNVQLDVLRVELVNKIKSSFEDKLDRLEVMESELYLISIDNDEALDMGKLIELKKKINELLEELNKIIVEYNLYNRHYYMDNFIGLEDKIIEDDIIKYREVLDSISEEKDFVKEYKMLDEFKKLYSNLVNIKNDTDNLIVENECKIQEVDIRDVKYKRIVEEVIKLDDVEKDCLDKIDRHNKYLSELASKIDIINRQEYVTTYLKGLGELVGQGLKFIGLKMLSPLSGIIPSIAVNTLMTKKVIGDMYNNLHYEEVKHVSYSAVNYDSELASKIVDIGYTEELINSTLKDIKKLREDFLLQYNSNIPGYSDTLKKINDIENIIYRNQNKVNIVKNKLIKNKKVNEDKMIKVKKLNEKMN